MPLCRHIAWLLLVPVLFSGCVSLGGSEEFESAVVDMNRRVTTLDRDLESSIAELNEKTAALIARVNENDRQVRLLYSLMEENQHKIDKLLRMLHDLKTTLYRHWGLDPGPAMVTPPRSGGLQIEPPPRPVSSSTSEDASAPPILEGAGPDRGDTEAYEEAKKLYDQESYGAALASFSAFLKAYPTSSHRHKAQFWIGKCYLNQDNYAEAIRAFETVRREHPDSAYMAFALHNQAVAHYQRGERDTAVALMDEVVANYPTSPAADHARRDLKLLRDR